jgi:tetratricopeptide (TPR) repeat protein
MQNSAKTLQLIALLLLVPGRARAQQAAADALFDSARANMTKGAFAEACEQFRASDKLDPAVGTELNLADCEEKRGRLASAWELFRTVAEKLPDNDERAPMANERARALQPRVPRLTLTLANDAPKNSTLRDGDVDLGSAAFGVALPMDPGAHEFVVSALGFEPRTFQVRLAEGDARAVTVAPGSKERASSSSAAARGGGEKKANAAKNIGSDTRTLGFSLAGGGVVGIGVGAVAGLLMLSKKSTVNDQCHADKSCSSAGLDAAHSAHTLQMISNVGWVVGAAALGAGAYFILSSTPNKPTTTLALESSTNGGQLSLGRTW